MVWRSIQPFRAPYPWDHILNYLARRAIPGVETVSANSYRRSVVIDGVGAVLEARLDTEGTSLVLSCGIPCDGHISRLRRMFDLDADPAVIDQHLATDPLLAPLIDRNAGLRVPKAWDPYELAIRTIVGQQVSVAWATTVTGRIAERFGTALLNIDGDDEIRFLFPTAERLANADLSSLGMPGKRAQAIKGFAAAVASGALDLENLGGLDETIERLCALPGIGPWTAHYIAMRGLGEADGFPDGDLGLQYAAAAKGERLAARQLAEMAENWRPWRAYAALHLWTSLD